MSDVSIATDFVDHEGVNPKQVPARQLYTGDEIPAIGLGTFGSDHAAHQIIAATPMQPLANNHVQPWAAHNQHYELAHGHLQMLPNERLRTASGA